MVVCYRMDHQDPMERTDKEEVAIIVLLPELDQDIRFPCLLMLTSINNVFICLLLFI